MLTALLSKIMSNLPKLYEYYTSPSIQAGLDATTANLTLNKKPITLYSGALHYFRAPPPYWKDRLRKMRAAGLNCIETYVPWNLHEPIPGIYDFGNGKTEFSPFLDLGNFLKLAMEEDLLVIVRPGPYICAEWDFGGLPSWLLNQGVKVRSNDPKFVRLVEQYFSVLLKLLAPLQFTKGGCIVAMQIENEFGNTKVSDLEYLKSLEMILRENGISELLFTSDTPSNGFSGTIPGILATANFQEKPREELALLSQYQPDRPLMVMEYWTGWFDHWAEKHHTRSCEQFGDVLQEILNLGASVNMYMFHGGTNWGFLNGANLKHLDNSSYQPDTTSYDYDAPLSEAGDYTDKFYKVKEIIQKHNKIPTLLPTLPEMSEKVTFPEIRITEMLSLTELLKQAENRQIQSGKNIPMELNHQSYGYINYRQDKITIPPNSVLTIEGNVCDTVLVLINRQLKSKILKSKEDLDGFGFWRLKNGTLNLGTEGYQDTTLDLLVENYGRVNYGSLDQFNQFKGLWQGNILLNGKILENWTITPLEFTQHWNQSLVGWQPCKQVIGPTFYKTTFTVGQPADTFIDMRTWIKGFVAINGFVLGRFLRFGPQQTLYLPGTFLKRGTNEICIFEHFQGGTSIKFVKEPIFELN